MDIEIPAGKYVLAVSGGVDSMVLLDLLAKKPGIELVVGHFNHGIRPDSAKDEELVAKQAKALKLAFEVGYGHLGTNASEETARKARYAFLEELRAKYQAKAIITAHHQDDLIETAALNLLRGTGWRGLSAITANKKVLRPLLGYNKSEVLAYAKEQNLKWREDSTNQSEVYLRNYVRNNVLSKLTVEQKQNFICNIEKVAKNEVKLNENIANLSHIINQKQTIDRAKFTALPADLGNELITYWLRDLNLRDFNRKSVNRLNMALRTSKSGTSQPVKDRVKLEFKEKTAQFVNSL